MWYEYEQPWYTYFLIGTYKCKLTIFGHIDHPQLHGFQT